MQGTPHSALRYFRLRLARIGQGLFGHHGHVTAKLSFNSGNAVKQGLRDINSR